jgi:thiol-disulfide isomerase/thioredoxin
MDAAARALCIGVTGGLIALAAALVAASVLGLALRRRAGSFRAPTADVLTETDLGAPLGQQATLVQFSTAFCAPCRPTRQILAQVAGMVDGVSHVEVDAAARLDLARRLRISSTPTVLVLDPDGAIVKRAVGLPRKADVIAALGTVIEPASPGITA